MFWLITLLYSCFLLCGANNEESSKLLFVQAISRHGDRAPLTTYPTDPNKIDSWPEGLGELTLLGKKQQYALGEFLRSIYQDFITTNPREVLVKSSGNNRCLTSAATTVASFFAPEGKWKFVEGLQWQPIPIHSVPSSLDKFLSYKFNCPRVEAEQARRIHSNVQEVYQKYQIKFEEVSTYSGMNASQGMNLGALHDILKVEKIHNLSIPEWVDFYWDEFEEATSAIFEGLTNSPLIIRLRAGPFLQEIDGNFKKKMNGTVPDLKVQMYFTHDINLITVLRALNFTNMPLPPYCATLLFELHEMADASMAVRLMYLNSTDPLADMGQPNVLNLHGCSEFCPAENFTNLFQHLIPENWEEECQLDSSKSCHNEDKVIFPFVENDIK